MATGLPPLVYAILADNSRRVCRQRTNMALLRLRERRRQRLFGASFLSAHCCRLNTTLLLNGTGSDSSRHGSHRFKNGCRR